jgi:hypothetical protein
LDGVYGLQYFLQGATHSQVSLEQLSEIH